MGYTHYWYRRKKIPTKDFAAIINDFRKIVPVLAEKYGVRLAGPDGYGDPVIHMDEISFNGPINCGHPENFELAIPWPSKDAGGVMAGGIVGKWYAGSIVDTRMCDGNCSYESFYFPREYKPLEWEEPKAGFYLQFCKTAFRPYDLAVTAFLIIAKHHLKNNIRVSSDGEDTHWFDAKILCQMELGYGMDYVLTPKGLKLNTQQGRFIKG